MLADVLAVHGLALRLVLVQLRIQRMQAVHTGRPVTQPLHPHLAEHGGKPPLVQALLGARHPVGPTHRPRRRPRPAAVHMRLEQHPQQLPTPLLQRRLQLRVAELPAVPAAQELDQLREFVLCHRELILLEPCPRRPHARPRSRWAALGTSG